MTNMKTWNFVVLTLTIPLKYVNCLPTPNLSKDGKVQSFREKIIKHYGIVSVEEVLSLSLPLLEDI